MIREKRSEHWEPRDTLFRWRGGNVSRLEGFSDAVFGFALTLLVVSLEVPKSYKELLTAMSGFFAFAACFAILFRFWSRHYLFFRRYGMEDSLTVYLNAILLFVVLFYVYPLKFVFTLFVDGLLHIETKIVPLRAPEIVGLFVIYGLGFTGIYLVFAMLHWNALHHRETLGLDPTEWAVTRLEIRRDLGTAMIGLLSVVIAWLLPYNLTGLAGFFYSFIGLVEGMHGAAMGRLQRLEAPSGREPESPPSTL